MSTEVLHVLRSRAAQPQIVEARIGEGPVVVGRVRVARSLWPRFLGLMGRDYLDRDEGLWLVPCRSIHMFFMRTAIDLAFLDRSGLVVRTVPKMRPWSLRPISVTIFPVRGAHSTLELASGTLERVGIERGVRLSFHPASARDPQAEARGGARGATLTGAGE